MITTGNNGRGLLLSATRQLCFESASFLESQYRVPPKSSTTARENKTMTFRDDNGWQYGKGVLESNRYMLDNEVATDVCFEVGTTEDAIVRIRAHKYVLISRSEVFAAMFSSGMLETLGGPEAMIRIEDIEPDVFKEMLRFIYSESAGITATSALDIMYAGKKYMLSNLVQQCCECLLNDLTTENVCQVLNQSLLLDESDLTQRCLDLVERESSEVLKPENLQYASIHTMKAIIRLDSLAEDETTIYDACINWAKAQLKIHESIDHPNDQQIRETLGDIIYDIRFPTMDARTFAKLMESSTVLSYEEHSAILSYIINNHKKETMMFNCKRRLWQWKNIDEHFVDRGGSIGYSGRMWKSGHDAIDVQTDKTILITGLGLLTATGFGGYTVQLEILKSTISVFKMSAFIPWSWTGRPYKVLFTTPVVMEQGILYTIIANSFGSERLLFRDSCRPVCHANNVSFFFFDTTCRDCNKTSISRGQIPRIYFKSMK